MVLGPTAVDAAAAGDLVGLRERKSLRPESGEELLLELAEHDWRVAEDDVAEVRGALGARQALEDHPDVTRRRLVSHARLVTGPREIGDRHPGRDVDEDARHGG